MSGIRRLALCAVLLVCATSCQGTKTETPEPKKLLANETAQELERLFAPMQETGTIACNTLRVRTHRALWDRFTYPVRSRVCELIFEKGGEGGVSRYRFKNVGGVDYPLKFVIGKRTFLVLGRALLEVAAGEPRFDVVAEGNVIAQEQGGKARDASFVRVEGGRWTQR